MAAWTVQALVDACEVHVLSWAEPDLRVANRTFGTDLRVGRFRSHVMPRGLQRVLAASPVPLALLSNQLLYREARRLLPEHDFEVVVGAMNEIDVGVPAIQYIHFPWNYWPRPYCDLRWYHLSPLVRFYRGFASWVSGYDQSRVAENLTVCNSGWTSRLFEEWYGVGTRTLYPPVPWAHPDVSLADRRNEFVCVGRISPEKRIEDVIAIVAGLRGRGRDFGLHIIGPHQDDAYWARVRRLSEPHHDWIHFHHNIPRAELERIVAHCRFGIHAMREEHFGIAVAELQRAGCLTFVPNGGGAVEIIGSDERLLYADVDEAVERIDLVIGDAALEGELRQEMDARRERFTEQRFMNEMRELVLGFDPAVGG